LVITGTADNVEDSTYAIISAVEPRIVVDSNVIVGSLISGRGDNRSVLRACLSGDAQPVVGEALFLEYEDVMGRPKLFQRSPLSKLERRQLLEAFLSVCEWVHVYYGWRPNLADEGHNHLIELAVAGGARCIVTNNIADFRGADLRFPQIGIVRPAGFIQEISR
jgi:putative PIN family toxin of toxin-antitoxin system